MRSHNQKLTNLAFDFVQLTVRPMDICLFYSCPIIYDQNFVLVVSCLFFFAVYIALTLEISRKSEKCVLCNPSQCLLPPMCPKASGLTPASASPAHPCSGGHGCLQLLGQSSLQSGCQGQTWYLQGKLWTPPPPITPGEVQGWGHSQRA